MISTKAQVQRVVRETVKKQSTKLTREEKWQVFLNVCDNLFKEGQITKQQHTNWTYPF
ncbi:hypothetical protein [Synechococcus phage S-H34]|uniref:Uncharacterized protein n=1 Tax=Synechococcus phage S-H34 TaxID=2718942 RepID=A0A6G8R713_9CAUD|nr:hypothetical protein PQC15_gp079 [Synechococcus phage S-H34]QIN96950.1 hypothetical protein [Synechococcus phage S-H34]